jgi:hypothetical protein
MIRVHTISRRVVQLDVLGIAMRGACALHVLLDRRLFAMFAMFRRRFSWLELHGGLIVLLHLPVAVWHRFWQWHVALLLAIEPADGRLLGLVFFGRRRCDKA